ncbi:hypothetical protein G9P44_000799 [Scheffersomyces stipitis]|nr:hypothetical protein G9P44_000799 [Scheffersomyces stipitis]
MMPHVQRQQRQRTRSVFQPQLFLMFAAVLVMFYCVDHFTKGQLDFDDALFLTRNSFKELKDTYMPRGIHVRHDGLANQTSSTIFNVDLDYPLNSVVNSFFPIDALIAFNTTNTTHSVDTMGDESLLSAQAYPESEDDNNNKNDTGISRHEITARYASFSPILNYHMRRQYKILPTNGCNKSDLNLSHKQYKNKVLIVLRGDCTFVDKVSNILNSGLDPAAVIVANDEPYRGLVTMFSANFNQDGSLRIPIMFITNEDYHVLKKLSVKDVPDITLDLSTASIGSWFSIIASMVLSPPLLIIIFYSIIICGQKLKRRQANIRNAKLVRELPVYIYNGSHLIHAKYLSTYLKVTGQSQSQGKSQDQNQNQNQNNTQNISSTISVKDVPVNFSDSPKQSPSSSFASLDRILVNGIDIRASANSLHILTAPENFYPAYKCSICLEKYSPLKSRVLVLDCKHIYHERCLSNWLINFRRSCPLCNVMINPSTEPYLLAGQDSSSSDYGSMDETDLEAQSNPPLSSEGGIEFITDSFSQDESEEEELYNDFIPPSTSSSPRVADSGNNHSDTISDAIGSAVDGNVAVDQSSVSYSPQKSLSTMALESGKLDDSVSLRTYATASTGPRKYFSKPSQILSQFSSTTDENEGKLLSSLSISIDSGEFVNESSKGSKSKSHKVNSFVSPPESKNDSDAGASEISTITKEQSS